MYLLNAFSLNMLGSFPASVQADEVDVATAREYALTAESGVGHQDTAAVFGAVLGVPVLANRATIALKQGDVVLVGQYRGPRLPEGASKLQEGATIQWLIVSVR